jgi:ABC-type lipoprotein export system ATPase subunit
VTSAVALRDVFRIHATSEGGVPALQGLTLDVTGDEICVVLGPSGSGKSTLLRLLAGLDRPSAGTVRVLDEELPRLSRRALAGFRARSLGYVDQHYRDALAPELTARELAALRPGLDGMSRRDRLARADELLERVGLLDRRSARPGELSGGERQRVALCAAVAPRPRLLLADEPTGELDAASARTIYELIQELAREEGCAAVLVSHDPESARIADRIVRIRDGRLSEEAVRAVGGEETIVVGRGGWLRLSEELLRRAGIETRATASLTDEGIVVARSRGATAPREDRLDTPPRSGAETGAPIVAELRDVTKRYGEPGSPEPVRRLSTTFAAGRVVAVTGRSGSGKTTVLDLLAGLSLPTEGDVSVLGTSLGRLDRDERASFRRDHIGYVAQDHGLVPFLGARENVELALALRGLGESESRDRAQETLAAVGLGDVGERPVAQLSTGQRQRVAVARAAAGRPRLLVVDEPTARLDQANAIAVGGLLARLARDTGAAVVCATHDPLLIEQADAELPLAAPAYAGAKSADAAA